ncbi:MAG TPA: hypothetical protein VH591_21475 [Ktedonobacterales bacterium]|jgi:hypothetical protein
MLNERIPIGRRRPLLLWLLPLMSLALAFLACSAISIAPRRAIPPPVTHLPASQLRLMIQINGQYGDAPTVQSLIHIFVAQSGQEVSLADKARLTCNGSDVKSATAPSVGICPRQPPGGAYRFTYTDEDGASTTGVVPVPAGQYAVLSPRAGSTVHIPTDGALAIRFALPIPPPNSSITLLEVIAACQGTPGASCDSIANNFFIAATPTPLTGVPSPTTFVNHGPPTPTPNSSKPTATIYENRGPPTPTPPPGSTPTAPEFDGTVTQTGGVATVALTGDYTPFQPGPGSIEISIEEQIAPDRGGFAAASAIMGGDTTTNITWVR